MEKISTSNKRKLRTRKKLKKVSTGKFRISVFKSLKNISAQIIDDDSKKTLVSASSIEKDIKKNSKKKSETSVILGEILAKRAKEKKIEKVYFDRGEYKYHGRVKALADAARDGTIKREEMGDGTITITSLGSLGALATTPIINYPEVAIVGINKMQIRPVWDGQQFQPRKMMNISCAFDHRVIDGWDAAIFVQKIKSLLENPAMLFVES